MPKIKKGINLPSQRKAHVHQIIDEESRRANLTICTLITKGQYSKLVHIRRQAMVRARTETGMTYEALAKILAIMHLTIPWILIRFVHGKQAQSTPEWQKFRRRSDPNPDCATVFDRGSRPQLLREAALAQRPCLRSVK